MRIQQGFHFGLTNQGIVNMILELDMKVCVYDMCEGRCSFPVAFGLMGINTHSWALYLRLHSL